ncbi:MAG: hypothetical protein RLZZ142_1421 [Verrucomicrobiota bacterium]
MEIYQLQYFLEVATLRSFTRAAERLHVAQPALSEQIRRLEAELGTRLIDRGRRESCPTAAGKVLMERAQGLLEQLDSTRRAVEDIAGLRSGRLVVAAIPSVSACLLPKQIYQFRKAHPSIELLLIEGTSEHITEAVESGRADLGIVQLPVPTPRLHSRSLLRESFLLLLPANHPLATHKQVPLSQLADEPFVFYKGRARDSALKACLQAGFAPKIACESGELETVRSLVAAGLGIAILPELATLHPPFHGACVRIAPPGIQRELAVISPKRRNPSPAAAIFTEMLLPKPRPSRGPRGKSPL